MSLKSRFKPIANKIPFLGEYLRFRRTLLNSVPLKKWVKFRLGINKSVYWPVHNNSEVVGAENIYIGKNATLGIRPGCYINGNGGIIMGDFARVASNCGIISSNHDVYNHLQHIDKPIIIGDHCWVGQNSLILAGVELGPRTIVAGGSIVTKSFPDGYCIIGGNPAKLIKSLDPSLFRPMTCEEIYHGFVPESKFSRFVDEKLSNKIKTLINSRLKGGGNLKAIYYGFAA